MVEFNFQDTYLRRLLGFLGMTDVETIGIEGVAFGADAAERAVSAALTQVSAVEAA
jgi:FMN-dependent NADH-azoreductase